MKSWNYLNFLAKNYTVSLACLLKNYETEELVVLKSKLNLDTCYTENLNVERSGLNLLKSYFVAPCLNVFRNNSKRFRNEINQLAPLHDLLLIDHYEMFQYVPKNFKGKVVLHTHNAEFMLWQRMSELSNNPIKKVVLALEAYRVKRYEKQIFNRSDLIYSTPSDIELYQKHGFTTNKHQITYHLGNDTLLDLVPLKFSNTEKAISFMGTMSWEPNIDGLVWFLQNVWPLIQKEEKETTLYLMGKDPHERILIAAKNDPKIIFTGFVKDLEIYLKKTRVYIAPLRFGSGMKVKVLEGLYRGNPTVSTSVGAEGLEVKNEDSILIADEASDFADACLQLLKDENLWKQLSTKSREIANKKYRWQPLFEAMDKQLHTLGTTLKS